MNNSLICVFFASCFCGTSFAQSPILKSEILQKKFITISLNENEDLYKSKGIRIVDLFKRVKKKNDINIVVKDEEMGNLSVVIGSNKAKLANMMEAVSAYAAARWEKEGQGVFALKQGRKELDIGFGAHSEHQQKRFDAGLPVIEYLKKGDAETRSAMKKGVAYSALPIEVQRAISDCVLAVRQQNEAEGKYSNLPTGTVVFDYREMLPRAVISMNFDQLDGFEEAGITVGGTGEEKNRFSFFRVNNYKQNKNKIFHGANSYLPEIKELKLKDLKNVKELNQIIKMDNRNTTLPKILKALSDKYGVNFICDTEDVLNLTHRVEPFQGTLREYLDTLSETFDRAVWEWRKSGFLIFRVKTHPALAEPKEN